MKDYYAILGVRSTTHAAEIKRVYRRLVVQYHPDKNPDPQAHAYMAEINEAYDVLSDPESRAAYDLRRQQGWAGLGVDTPAATPQAPRHRDPKYRPRPAPATSARKEQQRLMALCVPYIRWVNVVALVFTGVFFLDYILPYSAVEGNITNVTLKTLGSRGGRGGGDPIEYFHIDNGDVFKVYDFTIGPLVPGEVAIRYKRTLFYRTVMVLEYRGQSQNMAYVYRALALFPGVLLVSALVAVLRRRNVEFFFNATFVNAILLLITLWLIL